METKCNKCWFFEPMEWIDPYGCYIAPASCEHPDCYATVLYQHTVGSIEQKQKRVKNIIDFNSDGKCKRFEPCHYDVTGWWIFKKSTKVKDVA